MKATKLIINGEEQNLCDCSQETGVIIPVVSDYPANPVDWQVVWLKSGSTSEIIIFDETRDERVELHDFSK